VSLQPGRKTLSRAFRQQIDRLTQLQITQDGSVTLAKMECPVIHAQNSGSLVDFVCAVQGRCHGLPSKPQQGVGTDRHAQLIDQTSTGFGTGDQSHMLECQGKTTGLA
jgi:hypothetical protein